MQCKCYNFWQTSFFQKRVLVFFFILNGGQLLYNILMVFAIPQHESAIGIPMSSPSWAPLTPPSPPYPSRLSQSTGFGFPASYIPLLLFFIFSLSFCGGSGSVFRSLPLISCSSHQKDALPSFHLALSFSASFTFSIFLSSAKFFVFSTCVEFQFTHFLSVCE